MSLTYFAMDWHLKHRSYIEGNQQSQIWLFYKFQDNILGNIIIRGCATINCIFAFLIIFFSYNILHKLLSKQYITIYS